jgi:hypothetical protein
VSRFSNLTAARQGLVRLFQSMNYGRIEHLSVCDGDPVLSPAPVLLIDIKLGADDGFRPEIGLVDFDLPREIRGLMRHLDEMQNGQIEAIYVQAGLPRRMVLRSALVAVFE